MLFSPVRRSCAIVVTLCSCSGFVVLDQEFPPSVDLHIPPETPPASNTFSSEISTAKARVRPLRCTVLVSSSPSCSPLIFGLIVIAQQLAEAWRTPVHAV